MPATDSTQIPVPEASDAIKAHLRTMTPTHLVQAVFEARADMINAAAATTEFYAAYCAAMWTCQELQHRKLTELLATVTVALQQSTAAAGKPLADPAWRRYDYAVSRSFDLAAALS